MNQNSNLSVLPFYDSIELQSHKKTYAYDNVFWLITPYRRMLPFQIVRETNTGVVGDIVVNLYNFEGEFIKDMSDELRDTGLAINVYTGYDVIKYPSYVQLNEDIPLGVYYITLNDGTDTYYSEMFNVVRDVSNFLKIVYYDEENLEFDGGCIDYQDLFKWTMYIDSQVARPEYSFTEDVTDRDGYQFVEKQISEKIYKFRFLAPEYFLDALRLVRLSDHVIITSMGVSYTVDQFLFTPEWQTQSFYAATEVEFQCGTVIKKIGRGVAASDGGSFDASFDASFDV